MDERVGWWHLAIAGLILAEALWVTLIAAPGDVYRIAEREREAVAGWPGVEALDRVIHWANLAYTASFERTGLERARARDAASSSPGSGLGRFARERARATPQIVYLMLQRMASMALWGLVAVAVAAASVAEGFLRWRRGYYQPDAGGPFRKHAAYGLGGGGVSLGVAMVLAPVYVPPALAAVPAAMVAAGTWLRLAGISRLA